MKSSNSSSRLFKMKYKLMLIFLLLGSFLVISISAVTYTMMRDKMQESTAENTTNALKIYSKEISDMFAERMNELLIYADMPLIKSMDWNIIEPYLKEQHNKKKDFYDILFVADVSGNYDTVLKRKAGNLKDRVYWNPVMQGKAVVSEPVVSKSTGSLVSVIIVPVKDGEGKVIGAIAGNLKLDDFYNKIKDYRVNHKDSYCYVIDSKGKIIAHPKKDFVLKENISVKSENITQEAVNASDIILSQESGSTSYILGGINDYIYFSTVPNVNGWKLVVKVPFEYVNSSADEIFRIILLMTLIFLMLVIVAAYFIGTFTARPITAITEHMGKMSNGDFTGRIPQGLRKRKDELGLLSEEVDSMQTAVKEVVDGIIKEAKYINSLANNAQVNVEELNSQISDVSVTTNQLCGGMEQTAASTQEMTATSIEIEQAIESISEKAQAGSEMAAQINKSASKVKEDTILAQKETESMYSETKIGMNKAIEDSKSVEQINVLSEAILQITSQTNLLALNAAIEAARAGDAGKGFAVVADEIRKLAEQSKDTVTQIQHVTREITLSVNNLSSHSESILDFIESKILKDYRVLTGMSEQYSKDAMYYNDMSIDLSATSQELTASVQTVVKAISEIAGANNEAAEGTQNISQKIGIISGKASDTVRETEEVKKSADRLDKLVSKFKV